MTPKYLFREPVLQIVVKKTLLCKQIVIHNGSGIKYIWNYVSDLLDISYIKPRFEIDYRNLTFVL